MKRILFSSIMLVGAIALTLNSCKKEKPDTETQSAVDNTLCESEFSKIMPNVNSIAIKENGVRNIQTTCPVYAIDSSKGWPRILTLDYGTGCTDSIDGKVRKGKLICKFYSGWSKISSKLTITLENYFVNGISYAADSITVSHDAAATYTNVIYNGKCSNSGFNLEWSATRTLSQIAGANTPDPYDDVFQLTGNANGKNRNGLAYKVLITSPIIKRSSCSWIESGKLDLTPDGMATRTIDYGTGVCDNKANLVINGNTFSFTMN